jgi:two-component system, NtrC family, sensor kinase
MEFDPSSVIVKVGVFFVATKYLRKYFETASKNPQLDKILTYAWIGAFIICMYIYSLDEKYSDTIFYYWLFAFIIYCTWKLDDPKITKMVLIATLPVFITSTNINLLGDLYPSIYERISEQLETLNGFANTWVIGFSIYTFIQTKKERQLRQKEIEEHNQLMAEKNTLEYQVAERTAEITKQKNELEKTIEELKSTQTQLIHSEKMASLGELTAGIAHEIQNPLNFVNNFSEVSAELCEELNEYIDNETFDKTYIKELLTDLTQNQQKITHHGQRASSIVKGMLQHSRKSTGEKEMTDINALSDEYLRLSYHGLRAKDKTFNADFKTDLDPNLPKINVISQDIGRVLLNLINNSFYACAERSRSAVAEKNKAQNSNNFKPLVTVSTKLITAKNSSTGSWGAISITDNGSGMSEATKAKIFQPFFTTKPTGEGTGLGLSLAFDIVAKGHGGTIEVESEEGKGTTFTVKLPI